MKGIAAAARALGMTEQGIRTRIKRGMTFEEATGTPKIESRIVRGITPARSRVLEIIWRAGDVPPTTREIARATGCSSDNWPRELLEVLERDGYLRREPGRVRGLVLTALPVFGGDPARITGWIPAPPRA